MAKKTSFRARDDHVSRRRFIQMTISAGLGAAVLRWRAGPVVAGGPRSAPEPQHHGFSVILGAITPAATPRRQLQLPRREWAPGESMADLFPPGSLVSCVAAGEVTFEVEIGVAVIRHGDNGYSPSVQDAPLGVPIVCQTGDCLTFDPDTTLTVYRARNAGDAPAVLWEARLTANPLAIHGRSE